MNHTKQQKQNKMTAQEIKSRIEELKDLMNEEVNNNFANGELWNNCYDAIYRLETIGQENAPEEMVDENGYIIGYRLENGTEVIYEGMTLENSY